jgi:hypothetical protein
MAQRDASDTTRRRKQRVLYADKVIQQQTLETKVKIKVTLEGGGGYGAMSYVPFFYDFMDGTTETTVVEQESYKFSVTGELPPQEPAATVPDAPTGLSSTSYLTQLIIAFTAGFDGGSAITNYEYSIDGGATFNAFSPAETTSPVTISGLTANTTYSVMLRAVNAIGVSAESSALSTATEASAPTAPTLSTTLADDTAGYIYFYNADSSATNYMYSIDNGATFTALSPASITSPIKITGLTNGTSYTVKLRTLRGPDESVDSNGLSVTPVTPSSATAYLYYDPSNPSSYSGSGTTISNIGSYGALNGTMSASITYNASIASGILDFNGNSGVIITLPSINLGNTISVIGWVYPRSKANINGLFTNAAANVPTNGFKFQWNFWLTSSRAISFQAGNGTDGGDDHTPIDTITYNTWQHLAYVFDKTNQRIIMFLNGVPTIMSTDTITVANINTNAQAYIGGYAGGSFTMNAQLGYLKTFNTLLDATQVLADYNASRARFGL